MKSIGNLTICKSAKIRRVFANGRLLCLTLSKLSPANIFVGGQNILANVNIHSSSTVWNMKLEAAQTCIAARNNEELLFAGQDNGTLSVIDCRTASVVEKLSAIHSAGITALASEGNILISAGSTFRQDLVVPDSTLRIYDIRMLKMIMPWVIPSGSCSVKINSSSVSDGFACAAYSLCSFGSHIGIMHMDCEPFSRETLDLDQGENTLCFDVQPGGDLLACGSSGGTIDIYGLLSDRQPKDVQKMKASCLPFSLPNQNNPKLAAKDSSSLFSSYLGTEHFWGNIKAFLDQSLASIAQCSDGISFARNDRGILPNQVEITCTSEKLPGFRSSFKISAMDSDVSEPFWNQIIRVTRHCHLIYSRVIKHCHTCSVNPCFICELGLIYRKNLSSRLINSCLESMNVDSDERIHIQYFLQALHRQVRNFRNEYLSEPSSYKRANIILNMLIEHIFRDPVLNLVCRSCGTMIPWNLMINLSKLHGALNKSLQNCLDASLKKRTWCETCHGYRDFTTPKASELVDLVIFITDPSLFRQFHVLEDTFSYGKEQQLLFLKSVLTESPVPSPKGPRDFRAIIKLDNSWVRCRNELLCPERNIELTKLRPIALLFERQNASDLSIPIVRGTGLNTKALAIDAEYVFFERAQLEFYSDGSQRLIKPKRTRLARLSIVDDCEQILLDDYVEIEPGEVIADYCTSVSGIKEGDLNPPTSSYSLGCRKNILLLLQSLIDAQCTFIGHGLFNDFRVFNINIKTNQLLDTVRLFHIPGNRALSLRFLAWYLLEEKIQTKEHDSVVDARTVLFKFAF